MDRMAFAALWLMIFIVPWENTLAFPGLGTLARLVGAFALGLSVLTVLATGSLRRPHPFHFVAIGFVVWSALSILWTVDVGASQERVITYVQLAALTFLIWQHARTDERQSGLLQAYVLGAYVTAFDTLIRYAIGVSRGSRQSATGFNPNDVALILVLGIPIAWYLAFSKRGTSALVNAFYVPVAASAALLTASRGGLISLMVALLLVPWSLQRMSVRARLGAALLVVAAVASVALIVPAASRERLAETPGNIEAGKFTHRETIWKAAVDLFLDAPVAGVGAGVFAQVTQPLAGRRMSPHQTFLSVLVGQGLVGLMLFTGMIVTAFWSIHRMRGLQQKFWIVMALTLISGLLPRTWEYRKPTWLLLALVTAQAAAIRGKAPAVPSEQAAIVNGFTSSPTVRRRVPL